MASTMHKDILTSEDMNNNQIVGLGDADSDDDAVSRGYMFKVLSEYDFGENVEGVQTDASLSPVLTSGKRYILTNVSSLHANFGSISGVGNGDIVKYNGSTFDIDVDVSVLNYAYTVVFNMATKKYWKRVSGTWSEVTSGLETLFISNDLRKDLTRNVWFKAA